MTATFDTVVKTYRFSIEVSTTVKGQHRFRWKTQADTLAELEQNLQEVKQLLDRKREEWEGVR